MLKILLSNLLLLSFLSAFPQHRADTTFLSAAIENTIQTYQRTIGGQAKINNGSKYLPPKEAEDHHPYFLSEDWIMGDAFYDGEYFSNIPLMFDVLNSRLITEHHSSGHPIQLVIEKLDRFSISGHSFQKIKNESANGSLPATDFYDFLYPGETTVVARRQKVLREKIESSEIHTQYDEKTRYFILKNGVFFQVKSKSSVLKVLADQKNPLKKFMKARGIKFSLDRELALKSLAEFYDKTKSGKL